MSMFSWMFREPDPSTSGNAAPSSRAGAGPTTRALPPPRDQALEAQRSLPVEIDPAATADAQYELSRTAARLQRLALDVAASRVAHAEAVTRAETLCLEAAGAVRRLASAKEQRTRDGAQREADARSFNPFVSGPASCAQDASQQGEQAAGWDEAATTKHLDRIASGAMQVMRECGRAEGGYRIASELSLIELAGAPFGWSLPSSVEESQARERAAEPCASDAANGADATQNNPAQCHMNEQARSSAREDLRDALRRLDNKFQKAIARHTKKLQAAIDRDQKMAEEVAKMVLDALITVVTAGVGKGASKAVIVAGDTAAVDFAAVREHAAALAKKIGTDALKSTLKSSRTTVNPNDKSDPRYKQIGLAEGLGEATSAGIEGISHDIDSLDDGALVKLTSALNAVTAAALDEKLATIMTAFETQVQPIGQTRYSPGLLSVRRHTKKAARIKLSSGKTAYALVTYTDDVMPKNSQAARQLAAAGRDLARRLDGDDLLDQVNSDADYANAVQPDIEVEFVEWITNPKGTNIDFKGMVDGEAIDVPLNKLKGRPFVDPDGNLLDG